MCAAHRLTRTYGRTVFIVVTLPYEPCPAYGGALLFPVACADHQQTPRPGGSPLKPNPIAASSAIVVDPRCCRVEPDGEDRDA
jgi:hypothetical protein